jgi:hypothetical protein
MEVNIARVYNQNVKNMQNQRLAQAQAQAQEQ